MERVSGVEIVPHFSHQESLLQPSLLLTASMLARLEDPILGFTSRTLAKQCTLSGSYHCSRPRGTLRIGVGRNALAKNMHSNGQERWPAKSAQFVLDSLKNAEKNAEVIAYVVVFDVLESARCIYLSNCGCCSETVVTHLLRFWETRNVKKGREGS
ncbi:hypothetical protein HID58_095756 [Brassica napus]|uniref:Uncharacterized protein n=1 Tax=Brassica napus TaxID=3708 RepID=A0ABQ7X2G4_BRANA|nr:hypothetical protein HID58_095756 [Brassica napus]